jgi:anaerobic selenocysteine-containing dehydrogenase
MSRLGHALTELSSPPVKALVVYNSNPACIAPDQTTVKKGLAREDLFTVVLEQLQTDTTDYADIVLPATTFLEHTDLYLAYGHYYVQLARPVVAPLGECKSNVEVFRLLAKAMGFTDSCFDDSEDAMIRGLLGSGHPFLKGVTLDRLEHEHFVRLNVAPDGEPFHPFARGGFGTPSGKCEFRAGTLDYVPPVESRFGAAELRGRFPLELVAAKNDDSMNSTFGNREDTDRQTAFVVLHPSDAIERGVAEGDRVRVWNSRGSCLLVARVEESVARGVVAAPSVRWNKKSPAGHGINVLTSDRLTDAGGGPTFYSCLVQVEKIGD